MDIIGLLLLASLGCVVASIGMGWFIANHGGLQMLHKLYKLLLG